MATRLCGSEIIIGSFCAIERYEQSLVDNFTVCLDSSFYNHEDKKSNSTEQACWVLILSSTFLHAQKTWQWLSHLHQTVLLLAKWTSSLRFQRIPQPVAEPKVWASGQKFSWMGSTGHQKGEKRSWEVIVFLDVDVYTKTWNDRKTLWKTQKNNNLLKTKSTISKYEASGGPVFTFRLPGRAVLSSAPLVNYGTVLNTLLSLKTNEWQNKVLTLMPPILMCSARYRS